MENFHRSQFGQDHFVAEYLLPHKAGVFFEAGAIDGEFLSNTFYFEKALGWRGLLVEMMPWMLEPLKEKRPNARCVNCALGEPEGWRLFLNAGDRSGLLKHFEPASVEELERHYQSERPTFNVGWIQVRNIMSVIKEADLNHIDYFSLDVEGAEIPILQSIDFSQVSIRLFGIEDNRGTWLDAEQVLSTHGYQFIGSMHTDGFFVASDFARELGSRLPEAKARLTPRPEPR